LNSSANEHSRLATLWKRWTRTIDQVSEGRTISRPISDGEYVTLHAELVDLCRKLSKSAENPFTHKILSLVEPWVTLDTLRKAEPKILMDLRIKSVEVEARLTGRRFRRKPGWPFVRSVLIAAAGLLILAALWFMSDGWMGWGVFDVARLWIRRGIRSLRGLSTLEQTGLIAVAVAVLGTLLLRNVRKY
jgi:hypothetical protein